MHIRRLFLFVTSLEKTKIISVFLLQDLDQFESHLAYFCECNILGDRERQTPAGLWLSSLANRGGNKMVSSTNSFLDNFIARMLLFRRCRISEASGHPDVLMHKVKSIAIAKLRYLFPFQVILSITGILRSSTVISGPVLNKTLRFLCFTAFSTSFLNVCKSSSGFKFPCSEM